MPKERSYPAFEPGPNNGPWRDITLYAITGWYFQTLDDGRGGAFAFGGFIKAAKDGSFVGMFVDSFGASEICGKMTADTLSFDKHYFGQGHENKVKVPIKVCRIIRYGTLSHDRTNPSLATNLFLIIRFFLQLS